MGFESMISISYIPPDWGFGNRILFYNNLRQLAAKENRDWYCIPWEGLQYFSGDMTGTPRIGTECLEPCLGEKFFEWNTISTRDIFTLSDEVYHKKRTAAIHFRGGDFFAWNPAAVLDTDYYMNAIEEVVGDVDHFLLFTDDQSLPSYSYVVEHFKSNNISYSVGENTSNRLHYIRDFGMMSSCDYIISSPSTFCVCAGFVGKNKRIIHSGKWLRSRVDVDDKFWVDLNNGGNEDYRVWKEV